VKRFCIKLRDGTVVFDDEAATLADAIYEATLDADSGYEWTVGDIDFSGHDLSDVPAVPDIDRAILGAIQGGGKLCMSNWHGGSSEFLYDVPYEECRCGTTHCRAGWAIFLAGQPGFDLEDASLPGIAGALTDLRECAGVSTQEDTDEA
jgi:hypothetical protein